MSFSIMCFNNQTDELTGGEGFLKQFLMRTSHSSNHGWKPTLKMLRSTWTCLSCSPSLVSPLRTRDTTQPSGMLSSQPCTRPSSTPRRRVEAEAGAFYGSCSRMARTIWMMDMRLFLPSVLPLRTSYPSTQQESQSSIPSALGTATGAARRKILSRH